MLPLFEPLHLKDKTPAATGTWRLVYAHPDDSRFLVKVLRNDGKSARSRSAWYQSRPREGGLLLFSRELREYVAAAANSNGEELPIPRVLGLVETDLGLGLIVEKIFGRDGGLAPKLEARLEDEGFTREIQDKLIALVERINRHRVVLHDFKLPNIVCATDQRAGYRLVLVDGFGESALMPFFSLNASANSRRNWRKYRRLLWRINRRFPARINPAGGD